jgi:hypothetical protein
MPWQPGFDDASLLQLPPVSTADVGNTVSSAVEDAWKRTLQEGFREQIQSQNMQQGPIATNSNALLESRPSVLLESQSGTMPSITSCGPYGCAPVPCSGSGCASASSVPLPSPCSGVACASTSTGSCTPQCTWKCDSPQCDEVCEPICQPPVCETRCPSTPDLSQCCFECDTPTCSVQCPERACPSFGCPVCAATCSEPHCMLKCSGEQDCKTVCEQPQCEWKCKAPTDCPAPQCSMVCEQPGDCLGSTHQSLPPLQYGETSVTSFAVPASLLQVSRESGRRDERPRVRAQLRLHNISAIHSDHSATEAYLAEWSEPRMQYIELPVNVSSLSLKE